MKKISQISRKYKFSLGLILLLLGLLGLAAPLLPGIPLLILSFLLLRDFFMPKIISQAIDKTIKSVGEVEEEVEEKIKGLKIRKRLIKMSERAEDYFEKCWDWAEKIVVKIRDRKKKKCF